MNLIAKVRTLDDRQRLEEELELLLGKLYEEKEASGGIEAVLRGSVRSWVAEEIRPMVLQDLKNAEEYLRALKEALDKMRVIKLKIAFEPTESTIDKLSLFVKRRVGEDVVLDFEVDPFVFGGAEIAFDGKYRDFTLRRVFDEEYKRKEQELRDILNRSDF
jgi:hypothetical protein